MKTARTKHLAVKSCNCPLLLLGYGQGRVPPSAKDALFTFAVGNVQTGTMSMGSRIEREDRVLQPEGESV
jgi:hypothetical protein